MRQPKMYGLSDEMMYNYTVKTTDNGKVGFELLDEDEDSIFPLMNTATVNSCRSPPKNDGAIGNLFALRYCKVDFEILKMVQHQLITIINIIFLNLQNLPNLHCQF